MSKVLDCLLFTERQEGKEGRKYSQHMIFQSASTDSLWSHKITKINRTEDPTTSHFSLLSLPLLSSNQIFFLITLLDAWVHRQKLCTYWTLVFVLIHSIHHDRRSTAKIWFAKVIKFWFNKTNKHKVSELMIPYWVSQSTYTFLD